MDNIKRGEMFYISRGGASYNGSEQHSDRPAVVVSNDKNNENSNVVEVVYMTTQPKTDLPTHVTVRSTGRPSTVLCEQVYSVAGHGNRFEDIENQLIGEKGKGWRGLIAEAIDKAYDRLIASTPPQTEEEKTHCEMIKEAVKGMFINESRTAAEAEFIKTHIVDYEKIFDVCMNGDDLEFKKGLVRLQKMQNEYVMQREDD